ncbi:MAG TPA: metal transporter [Burkholderiales bacterium]|nr:metal transporter [Burkholderiales bacterium]
MKARFGIRPVIVFVSLIVAVAILVLAMLQIWRGNALSKAVGDGSVNSDVQPGGAASKNISSDNLAPGASADKTAATGGFASVKLSAAMQAQSGIKAEQLETANYQPEAVAYGTVLDLQSLTGLRTRFNAALAEAEIARSAVNASKQEYERSKALYQDNQNTSLKALQMAEQAYLTDEARLAAASLAVQDIKGSARQQFGELLASWALARQSPEFQKFLEREEVIVRITLPPGLKIPAPSKIRLVANNNPPVIGYLVSASPQSDPAILGTAYFYRTATVLAAGTHVAAHFATSHLLQKGVSIPGAAVVWYAGQAWAYVQLDQDRFERRPVPEDYLQNGGYFVTQGFKPGDRVVVTGTQLVLSEELRSQIQTGESEENN